MAVGGELERVAVAARHERRAAAALLGGDRGRQEIVGLVAGRLCVGEAAGRDELRQRVELLEQRVVELAARSDRPGNALVPIGRRVKRVPADEHGARLLGLVEAQQDIGEADDGAGAFAAAPQNGLRQARDRSDARRSCRR